MKFILAPAFVTLACYLINSLRKVKHVAYYYALVFFLVLFILFIFDKVEASVNDDEKYIMARHRYESLSYSHNINMDFVFRAIKKDGQIRLSNEEIQYFREKVQFHKSNAERTYADAKQRSWYLPDQSDQERAKYCFATAVGLIGPSDMKSRLVAAVLALMTFYGLDCIDEWNYIETKLNWSMYHYEMMEFYSFVLNKCK